MTNKWGDRIAIAVGYTAAAFIMSVVASAIMGGLFFLVYNNLLLGVFSHAPLTYVQSFGLLFCADILMTPSAVLGMNICSSALTTSEQTFHPPESQAGQPTA